jgi:transposase InsO family protein
MNQRNSYHTTIKLAYALDIHKQWLPNNFTKEIPRSTSHSWKNENQQKYVGLEYAITIGDNVDELKLIYDNKLRKEKQLFIAYTRLKLTLIEVLGKKAIQQAMKDNYRVMVRTIEASKNTFDGGIKTLCNFLDINVRCYNYWKSVSKYLCPSSPVGICVKKVPSQLSVFEIYQIKRLLNRSRFRHWPICSVWGWARRKGMTSLSLSSWYRYNSKYQFRVKPKRGRFKKDYHPIRAPRPNHTWHADVTVVDTEIDGRFYVYLIVDNYSKYIINYKVSDRILGSIRTQTLRDAVHQEFGDDLSSTKAVDLIVDGGSENNNRTIEQYIKNSNVKIDKKIALKDIKQSNSMVEASNKILKHRYLFQKHLYNREHLEKHLREAVHDFCYKRPHYALGVYTPFEVHYNRMPKMDLTKSKQAVKERKLRNQVQGCGIKCS